MNLKLKAITLNEDDEKLFEKKIDSLMEYNFKETITREEMRSNLMFLNEILMTDTGCKMLGSDECVSEDKMHLTVSRENEKLVFSMTCCNKFLQEFEDKEHQRNFVYNYYKDTDISNVFLTKENFANANVSVGTIIKDYLLNKKQDNIKGMYINGTFGVGKTYLMFAFANDLIKQKGVKVCFVFLPEYINIIKKSFGDNNAHKDYVEHLTDNFKNIDILFIDDIGTEVSSEWFYIEYLFNILNYRMSKNKTTFFCSNLSLKQLEDNFHSKFKEFNSNTSVLRLMDRIRALVGNKEYQLKGENFRYDR